MPGQYLGPITVEEYFTGAALIEDMSLVNKQPPSWDVRPTKHRTDAEFLPEKKKKTRVLDGWREMVMTPSIFYGTDLGTITQVKKKHV